MQFKRSFKHILLGLLVTGAVSGAVGAKVQHNHSNLMHSDKSKPNASTADKQVSASVLIWFQEYWVQAMGYAEKTRAQSIGFSSAAGFKNVSSANWQFSANNDSTPSRSIFLNKYNEIFGKDSATPGNVPLFPIVPPLTWANVRGATLEGNNAIQLTNVAGLASGDWKVQGKAYYQVIKNCLVVYNNLYQQTVIDGNFDKGTSSFTAYSNLQAALVQQFIQNSMLYFNAFFKIQANVDAFSDLIAPGDDSKISFALHNTGSAASGVELGYWREAISSKSWLADGYELRSQNVAYLAFTLPMLPLIIANMGYTTGQTETDDATKTRLSKYFNMATWLSNCFPKWLSTPEGISALQNEISNGFLQADLQLQSSLPAPSISPQGPRYNDEDMTPLFANGGFKNNDFGGGLKIINKNLGGGRNYNNNNAAKNYLDSFLKPMFNFVNNDWKIHQSWMSSVITSGVPAGPFDATKLSNDFTFNITKSATDQLDFANIFNFWDEANSNFLSKMNSATKVGTIYLKSLLSDSLEFLRKTGAFLPEDLGYNQDPAVKPAEYATDMNYENPGLIAENSFRTYFTNALLYSIEEENAFWNNTDVINIKGIFTDKTVSADIFGFDKYDATKDKAKFDQFFQDDPIIWQKLDKIKNDFGLESKDLSDYAKLWDMFNMRTTIDAASSVNFRSNSLEFLEFMKVNGATNTSLIVSEINDLLTYMIKKAYTEYQNNLKSQLGFGQLVAIDANNFPIATNPDYKNIFYFNTISNSVIPNSDNVNYFTDSDVNNVIIQLKGADPSNLYTEIIGNWVTVNNANVPLAFTREGLRQLDVSIAAYKTEIQRLLNNIADTLKPSIFVGIMNENEVFGNAAIQIPTIYREIFTNLGYSFSTRQWTFNFTDDASFKAVLLASSTSNNSLAKYISTLATTTYNINGQATEMLKWKSIATTLSDFQSRVANASKNDGAVTVSLRNYIVNSLSSKFLRQYFGYDLASAQSWWLGYSNTNNYNTQALNIANNLMPKILKHIENADAGYTGTTAASLTFRAATNTSAQLLTDYLTPLQDNQVDELKDSLNRIITTDNINILEAYKTYNWGWTDANSTLPVWINSFFDSPNNPTINGTVAGFQNKMASLVASTSKTLTVGTVTFNYNELLGINVFNKDAKGDKSVVKILEQIYNIQLKNAFDTTNQMIEKLNLYYLGFAGTRSDNFINGGRWDFLGYNFNQVSSYNAWTKITDPSEMDRLILALQGKGIAKSNYFATTNQMGADLGQIDNTGVVVGSGMVLEQITALTNNLFSTASSNPRLLNIIQQYSFGYEWSNATFHSDFQSLQFGWLGTNGMINYQRQWNWAPNQNTVFNGTQLQTLRTAIGFSIITDKHNATKTGSIIQYLLNQGPTTHGNWTVSDYFKNLNPVLESYKNQQVSALSNLTWDLVQRYNTKCLGFDMPGLTDSTEYLYGWNNNNSRHWNYTQSTAVDLTNSTSLLSRMLRILSTQNAIIPNTKNVYDMMAKYDNNYATFEAEQAAAKQDAINSYGPAFINSFFGFSDGGTISQYLEDYFGWTPGVFMNDPTTVQNAITEAISGITGDNPWDTYHIVLGNGTSHFIGIGRAFEQIKNYNLQQITTQLTSLISFYQTNYRGFTGTKERLIGFGEDADNNWILGHLADPTTTPITHATGVIKAFLEEQIVKGAYVGEWINADYSQANQLNFKTEQENLFTSYARSINAGYMHWFLGYINSDKLTVINMLNFAPGFNYSNGWNVNGIENATSNLVGVRSAEGIKWEKEILEPFYVEDPENPLSNTNGSSFRHFYEEQIAYYMAWQKGLIQYLTAGYFGYNDGSVYATHFLSFKSSVEGALVVWAEGNAFDGTSATFKMFDFFRDKANPDQGKWFKIESLPYWTGVAAVNSHAKTFINTQFNAYRNDSQNLLVELQRYYFGFTVDPITGANLNPNDPTASSWFGGFNVGIDNWTVQSIQNYTDIQVANSRHKYIDDWRKNSAAKVELNQETALSHYLYGADGKQGLQLDFLKGYRGFAAHKDGRVLTNEIFGGANSVLIPEDPSGAFGYNQAIVFTWLKSKANPTNALWIKKIVDNAKTNLPRFTDEQTTIFKQEWLTSLANEYGIKSRGYFLTVYGTALQYKDLPGYQPGSTAGNYNINAIADALDKITRNLKPSPFTATGEYTYSSQATTEYLNNADKYGEEQITQESLDLASKETAILRAGEIFTFVNNGYQNNAWNTEPTFNYEYPNMYESIFGRDHTFVNTWSLYQGTDPATAAAHLTSYLSQFGVNLTYLVSNGVPSTTFLTPDGFQMSLAPDTLTGDITNGARIDTFDKKGYVQFWMRQPLASSSPYRTLIMAINNGGETIFYKSNIAKINDLSSSGSQTSFAQYQYKSVVNDTDLIAKISTSTDDNINKLLPDSFEPGTIGEGASELLNSYNGHTFGFFSFDTWINIYIRDFTTKNSQQNDISVVHRLIGGNNLYTSFSSDEIINLLPNIIPPKDVEPLPVWAIPVIVAVLGLLILIPVLYFTIRRFNYKINYAGEIKKIETAARLRKEKQLADAKARAEAKKAKMVIEQKDQPNKVTVHDIHDENLKK